MQQKTRLWAKGSGSTGCLLRETLDDQPYFLPLELPFTVKELALSGSFAMATDDHQNVYIWGTLNKQILEKPLLMKKQVTRLSCGWQHAIVQSSQGLWGLGTNANYELGIETTVKFMEEAVRVWQGKVEKFICGFRQSYVIAQNALFGCGESRKYELGIAQKTPIKWRQIYPNLSQLLHSQVVQMSCGKRFLLLRTADCNIWAIGCNEQNSFNNKEITHLIVPNMIFNSIQDVSCGWAHVILLAKDQTIHTYGRNNLGQLGRPADKHFIVALEPQEVVQKVVSGTEFGFAVTSLNRVFGWGWNQHANLSSCGQWSLDSPKNIKLPVPCCRVWTHPAITIVEQVQQ